MAKIKEEVNEAQKAPKTEIDRAGLQALANTIKVEQSIAAVTGIGKSDSKDKELAAEARAQGLYGNDAVIFVYKGRGGLVDVEKAAANRAAEAKAKKN